MSHYVLEGVRVVVPERALRPREPAPPAPSATMNSPLVGTRFLRPRSRPGMTGFAGLGAVEPSLRAGKDLQVGKGKDFYLDQIRSLKAKQRGAEKLLGYAKISLERYQKDNAKNGGKFSALIESVKKQIDDLVNRIMALSAQANEAALAAIKAGATRDEVRAIAADIALPEQPAVETASPTVAADGSIIPGPDAKVIGAETGKPLEPGTDASDDKGMSVGVKIALAAGALFLLSRAMR